MRLLSRLAGLVLLAPAMLPSIGRAEAPVFTIARGDSSIKFHVNASIALDGTFDKWTGTLKFSSADVTTAVLDLEVQAASVDTGSGLKNSKLKGDDFFAVDQNPTISFRSTKVMQTSTNTFAIQGNFTIRGVSRPETLTLAVSGKGTGTGAISGTMAFDRRDYGMNSGIPFIRIADRVEVTVDIKVRRVGGPPLVFKE